MTKFIRMQQSITPYTHGESEPLSKWDRDTIINAGIDIAVYSYFSGSYEGSGTLLFQKNNKWFYHDMGHCSCYGPLDGLHNINDDTGVESLIDILDNFSEELRATVYVLVSSYDALDEEEIPAEDE